MTAHLASVLERGALTSLAPSGTWLPAPLYRTSAAVQFDVDQAEHARRRDAGIAAVTEHLQLSVLFGLPVGIPWPLEALSTAERVVLSRFPAGVVDIDGLHVTRRLVRPGTPRLAVVTGQWKLALQRAGRFAPFCARAILVRRDPGRDRLIEADLWGVGVLLDDSRYGVDVLVPPTPWKQHRFTAAGWSFTEMVYAQLLASSSPDPGATP